MKLVLCLLLFHRIIISLSPKELFDSIASQIAEIRTIANSLPLLLKLFAKSLFFNRLSQTSENLKYFVVPSKSIFSIISGMIDIPAETIV